MTEYSELCRRLLASPLWLRVWRDKAMRAELINAVYVHWIATI